jgi:hypothetical protein
MRWRWAILIATSVVLTVGLVLWIVNAGVVDDWLSLHSGVFDESGPYYGFWSGIGSDFAELGLIGAVGTAVYQLVKRFNCHEPGCWRVGTHLAAGGQFALCYRHHPDYQGKRPGHDLIVKLHREDAERQAAIHQRLVELQEKLLTLRADPDAGLETSAGARSVSAPAPHAEGDGHR